MTFHTPLKQAKASGSTKHGHGHWWAQRLTAIALIPLTFVFVISIIQVVQAPAVGLSVLMHSVFYTVGLILLFVIGLHHATLGMQMIIEDYVHCRCLKVTYLVLLYGVNIVTGLTGVVAAITYHVLLLI